MSEPVKQAPEVVLAEKIADLTALAATTEREYRAGIISQSEWSKRRQWTEADLTEVWREYVHSLK
jgi:hypothetical protein